MGRVHQVPTDSLRLAPEVTAFFRKFARVFADYPDLWVKGGIARDALLTYYADRTQPYRRALRTPRDIDVVLIGGSETDKRNLLALFEGQVEDEDIDIRSRTKEQYFRSRDLGVNEVLLRPEGLLFTQKAVNDLIRGEVHPAAFSVSEGYWDKAYTTPRIALRSALTALRGGLDVPRTPIVQNAILNARPFDLLVHLYRAFDVGIQDEFFAIVRDNEHLFGVNSPEEAILALHPLVYNFTLKGGQQATYDHAVQSAYAEEQEEEQREMDRRLEREMVKRRRRRNPDDTALTNPIPELVKGTRTPYKTHTVGYERLSPRSRDDAFAKKISAAKSYVRNDGVRCVVYDFFVRVFRALGSGKHWVGVMYWTRCHMNGWDGLNLVITLQSGKSWSIAENKVLRWLKGQHDEVEETGSGSLGFLKWVYDHVKSDVKNAYRWNRPQMFVVGWADEKRERAYAWLTRLGFVKVDDHSGHGYPAYVFIYQPDKKNPMTERTPGVPDLAGRHIPARYLEGLPKALQEQRRAELTASRDAYHRGDFSELPTDRAARKMGLVKLSAYREVAQARGFDISQTPDLEDMARAALRYYTGRAPAASTVQAVAEGLQKVYAKGLAAWKSGGHRPGASARNWADARVASLLVGGKAAWTADRKQFALLPEPVRQAIIRQLPDVYAALQAQGRMADVQSIQSKAAG